METASTSEAPFPAQPLRYVKMAEYILEELAHLPPVIMMDEDVTLDERNDRLKAMMILRLLGFDVERTIYADLTKNEAEQLRLMITNTQKSYPDGFQNTPQLLEQLEYCGYIPVHSGLPLLRYAIKNTKARKRFIHPMLN